MTYSAAMNQTLLECLGRQSPILAFGQNIGAGSHLSGLTSGINDVTGCEVFNTPNCENAEVGFGFGLMLEGAKGIFFVKQQDFLLLGLDQLVNTANVATALEGEGSFTIAFVTVDSGYEGPQSRLNQFSEFCHLSAQPGYTISSRQEAEFILSNQLGAPGFRMIGFSQRLFREPEIDLPNARLLDQETGAFCYVDGTDVTLVACNFALPHAMALAAIMDNEFDVECGIVSVPRVDSPMSEALAAHIGLSDKVAVLDDSHSRFGAGRVLAEAIRNDVRGERIDIAVFDRSADTRNVAPNTDDFQIEPRAVAERLGL